MGTGESLYVEIATGNTSPPRRHGAPGEAQGTRRLEAYGAKRLSPSRRCVTRSRRSFIETCAGNAHGERLVNSTHPHDAGTKAFRGCSLQETSVCTPARPWCDQIDPSGQACVRRVRWRKGRRAAAYLVADAIAANCFGFFLLGGAMPFSLLSWRDCQNLLAILPKRIS